ncbi:hypothetical protein KKD62_03065 [Patescibacteria group bacterium]|nr:hypothetical protein [Patescibacteria group bacterium]MBU1931556.1 hypothetical protein [Patescibacteria group bacterium]
MKIKIGLIILIGFLLVVPTALAQGQGNGLQQRVQDPAVHESVAVLPSGNQVQNQNQLQTKNQGDETQLQIASQHMEQLMAMEEWGGEVGVQVKTLAQEQVQAQSQIQQQLNRLEVKTGFMKKLFGPDYKAIKNLKQQMEQNQNRIQQLQQLQTQLQNQAEETQLQLATQALVNQNMALQEQVQAEEQVGSVFGWLMRLFN